MKSELDALARLPHADLVARYVALYGREPRCGSRQHLVRRVAWKLQERAMGGLSGAAKARLNTLMTEITLAPEQDRNGVAIGTVLVREWKGRQVRLTVHDNGYEVDGTLHASLSAAARAVTGSAWNGRLFFGLRERSA